MTSTHASKAHTRAGQKSQYVQPVAIETKQYERMLSNGKWYTETNIDRFIDRLIQKDAWYAKRENRSQMTTAAEVFAKLATGCTLSYDNDWYAQIRELPILLTPKAHETKLCDCGHEISKSLVMSASLGSSCPNCYDRMSD